MLIHLFWQFFVLGCLSFGGPIAHVSYFQHRFVHQLAWLDDREFSRLYALCTLLPGPTSSQLGFAIGYHRRGILGALAACIAFTLPSFTLMFTAAVGLINSNEIHWLKMHHAMALLAFLVVADACAAMLKGLIQDRRQLILVIIFTMGLVSGINTILLIVGAVLTGVIFHRSSPQITPQPKLSLNLTSTGLFACLLALSWWARDSLFGGFYLTGSSVFGGGHVMLPLLQHQFSAVLDHQALLSAYALAQAIPGPMFTIATYLGAVLSPENPLIGALSATLGIFIPGFLAVLMFYKGWQHWQEHSWVKTAMYTLNPAMIALLLSSLFTFIVPHSIHSLWDIAALAIASLAFIILPKGIIWAAVLLLASQFIG